MGKVLICQCGNDKFRIFLPFSGQPMTFRCVQCLAEYTMNGLWMRLYNKETKKYDGWKRSQTKIEKSIA